MGRARERNAEALRRCRRREWPAIKKKPKPKGARSSSSTKAGISQRPHRVRTWSRRGQTPILQYNFNGDTLSAVAGITFYNFYFRLYKGSVKTAEVIDFLGALLRHIPGPLLIVWDRLSAHRSKRTRDFIYRPGQAVVGGIPPKLCPRTEPGRIHLGVLEAACVVQCLSEGLLKSERGSAPNTEKNAAPSASHHSLLASGRANLLMYLYYANINSYHGHSTILNSWPPQ